MPTPCNSKAVVTLSWLAISVLCQTLFSELVFPNAPPVQTSSRYAMAVLAVGDKAEVPSFYAPFIDSTEVVLPSTSSQSSAPVPTTTFDLTFIATAAEQSSSTSVPSQDADCNQEELWSQNISLLTQHHAKFGSTSSGLKKMVRRLQSIRSSSQWESYLHTGRASTVLRRHPYADIRVQPGSVSRRRLGVSRGSKRRPAGRPPLSGSTRRHKKTTPESDV